VNKDGNENLNKVSSSTSSSICHLPVGLVIQPIFSQLKLPAFLDGTKELVVLVSLNLWIKE
jgi:hypothetical protein